MRTGLVITQIFLCDLRQKSPFLGSPQKGALLRVKDRIFQIPTQLKALHVCKTKSMA